MLTRSGRLQKKREASTSILTPLSSGSGHGFDDGEKQRTKRPKTSPNKKYRKVAAAATTTLISAAAAASLPPHQTLAFSPHFSSPNRKGKTMFAAKKKKTKSSEDEEKGTPRTKSFGALWAGNVASEARDPTVAVHTLLLGTHPSIASLEHQKYYAHPLNAFWWIAGDCLGFRRASGRNKSGDGYYGFVSDLRHGEDDILPYHKQIDVMVTNGFALWDVVQSCHRPGSLDADIQDEIPNDIYGFCQEHPTIERIVFSNGGTGCKIFNKHFRDWWKSGQLIASTRNEESVKNFKSMTKLAQKEKDKDATTTTTTQQPSSRRKIECISALSVSPAAARYPYAEKRDFWDEHVYKPALRHQQDD